MDPEPRASIPRPEKIVRARVNRLGVVSMILLAGVAAGCVSAPATDVDAAAASSQDPPASPSLRFEGAFSGVSAGVGHSVTHGSGGIHRFKVPPGDPGVVIVVSWTGTSPTGLRLAVGTGNGTGVADVHVPDPTVCAVLDPGVLPSGKANAIMWPAAPGVSLDIQYRVEIHFSTTPTCGGP